MATIAAVAPVSAAGVIRRSPCRPAATVALPLRSVRAAALHQETVTALVFDAAEVKSELASVTKAPDSVSYARTDFHEECESAINEQINIELNVSYIYQAMYCFFSRDNVALPGIAAHFKKESLEERTHAELLMDYQNLRGGRVVLQPLMTPELEYSHAEKGDALYAFELSLSLEKLNFQKLRALHDVADKHGDSQMADFIEGQLLADQAASVKENAEFVSQLRRVGKGLGVYQFDEQMAAQA